MALATLKPRLATINTNRVKVLDTKAGSLRLAWQPQGGLVYALAMRFARLLPPIF